MTSTYSIKLQKISNVGVDFVLPSASGTPGQVIQNDGFGNTNWQDPTGGNLIGGSKIFVHARRTSAITNDTLSTMRILRSHVMIGSQYLSGNPSGDNLWWDTFTIPSGYSDGIWYFDPSGWICGNPRNTNPIRMTVVRPSGPTTVYNQSLLHANGGCGIVITPFVWDGFQAGDQVSFQIVENTAGTMVSSITNPASQEYGKLTIVWYPKNATYQTNGYISTSNISFSTGTVEQTGNTVIGTDTAGGWSTLMVGAIIIFTSTNLYATITAVDVPGQQLTVDISQTIAAGSNYIIYRGGTHLNATNGTAVASQTRVKNNIRFGNGANITTLASTGSGVLTLPASTTLVGVNETATLTNKTLTNPTINTTSTITHNSLTIDTGTTDTSRTSASVLLTYNIGNITEVIRSMLISGVGNTLAPGWVAAGGTTLIGQGNVPWSRILIVGNNGTLTYTSFVNLPVGVYRVTYGIESESNRGIHLIQYRANGDPTYYNFRTYDAYFNSANGVLNGKGSDLFEDYFTVTTPGNPFNFRVTCASKNGLAADFIAGICFSLIIYRLG